MGAVEIVDGKAPGRWLPDRTAVLKGENARLAHTSSGRLAGTFSSFRFSTADERLSLRTMRHFFCFVRKGTLD